MTAHLSPMFLGALIAQSGLEIAHTAGLASLELPSGRRLMITPQDEGECQVELIEAQSPHLSLLSRGTALPILTHMLHICRFKLRTTS